MLKNGTGFSNFAILSKNGHLLLETQRNDKIGDKKSSSYWFFMPLCLKKLKITFYR
jgi:hypothetical protein